MNNPRAKVTTYRPANGVKVTSYSSDSSETDLLGFLAFAVATSVMITLTICAHPIFSIFIVPAAAAAIRFGMALLNSDTDS